MANEKSITVTEQRILVYLTLCAALIPSGATLHGETCAPSEPKGLRRDLTLSETRPGAGSPTAAQLGSQSCREPTGPCAGEGTFGVVGHRVWGGLSVPHASEGAAGTQAVLGRATRRCPLCSYRIPTPLCRAAGAHRCVLKEGQSGSGPDCCPRSVSETGL